jgi:hypothetical protein
LSDASNEYENTLNENVSDLSDDGALNNTAVYKVKTPADEPIITTDVEAVENESAEDNIAL